MAEAKARNRRRWALAACTLAALWVCGVWPPPVWWRNHWPRETAMMRLRGAPGAPLPVPLPEIGPVLQRMVLIGEDSRFRTHHGLDLEEIRDALGLQPGAGFASTARAIWKRRDRLRGASTITQQLAKNLYLSPTRNPLRKVKEAATALRLEAVLPKDRILELYLNIVEMGDGVWGMPAASERYFGTPPARLEETQAAALAATLPHPRTSNPGHRPARMQLRRDLILARYRGVEVYIPPEEDMDSLPPVPPFLPPITTPAAESLITTDSLRVVPSDSVRDTTAAH